MHSLSLPLRSSTVYLHRPPVTSYLKSAATITTLAAEVLGSAALAYYHPKQWFITALSATFISLYGLPKILRHGNASMIQIALAVSLTALGCLAMGGALAFSCTLGLTWIAHVKAYALLSSLITSFLLTGVIGYGIPVSYEILKKAYSLFNHPYWQRRFAYLKQRFNQLPEIGYGFLQMNLTPNLLWLAAFVAPDKIPSFLVNLDPKLKAELDIAMTSSLPTGLDQVHALAKLLRERRTGQERTMLIDRLKRLLDDLSEADLLHFIGILQDMTPTLIPQLLSKQEFIELFQGTALRVLNDKIDGFLDGMVRVSDLQQRCNGFLQEMEQVQASVSTQNRDVAALARRLEQLHQHLDQLNREGEFLYREQKRWQALFDFWGQDQLALLDRLSQIERLKHTLSCQPARQQLQAFYRTLNPEAGAPLIERVQRLIRLNSNQIEPPMKACHFLRMERCGFGENDYEEMRQWLHLDTTQELESKFDELGLSTEEHLYQHQILPRQGQVNKDDIKHKLRVHFEEHLRTQENARNRLYSHLTHAHAPKHVIVQKVLHVFYRLLTMGLILVPVALYPIATAVGAGCGLVYFVLKRFGILRNFVQVTESGLINLVTGRNFFSLTPAARQNMETFMHTDFFGRFRLINLELLATLMISLAQPQIGLGGFIQGAALINEVAGLIWH